MKQKKRSYIQRILEGIDGLVESHQRGMELLFRDRDHNIEITIPEMAQNILDVAMLRRYEHWLMRVQRSGIRDPKDPFKTLPPSHPLAKRQIKKLRTEIKFLKGEISRKRYYKIMEKL